MFINLFTSLIFFCEFR